MELAVDDGGHVPEGVCDGVMYCVHTRTGAVMSVYLYWVFESLLDMMIFINDNAIS